MGVPEEEEREKGTERIFKEIMGENFTIWWNTWIYTFEKLNGQQVGYIQRSYTKTHYNQTPESQRQRENPESNKKRANSSHKMDPN